MTASLGNRPDRAEAAAEEDEANAIGAVGTTCLKQRLEGPCDLDNNALHLIDVLHAPHEVGQVQYLTPDDILRGVFFEYSSLGSSRKEGRQSPQCPATWGTRWPTSSPT